MDWKGRGAQQNLTSRFIENKTIYDEEILATEARPKTQYFNEHAKQVVNKMTSPDLPSGYSLNPYQGCEHGCIYCYARNTHEYYGYSFGLDFEQKIIVKRNVVEQLKKTFAKKNWKGETIMLSGNTDCYQPAERKFQLTRAILHTCYEYGNPVSIITKNALVLRDMDILQKLAARNLVRVVLSITTLNEELRRKLEPRTVSGIKRLEVLKTLDQARIPTGVMTAPIIPSLNDHEIPQIVKASFENGAKWVGYTVVRLNGGVSTVFKDWVQKAFPNKAAKVLDQIANLHGGKLNDSRRGIRMKGEGVYSEYIRNLHKMSVDRYGLENKLPPLDHSQFSNSAQLSLFQK